MPWILIFLGTLLALTIAAIRYLPWWGVILYLVALVLSIPQFAKLIFLFYVHKVSKELSSALNGAEIEVTAITPVRPPSEDQLKQYFDEGDDDDDDDDDNEDPTGRMPDGPPDAWNWYELEVGVTPQAVDGQEPEGWNAEALALVPPGTARGELTLNCLVVRHEYRENGRYVPVNRRQFYDAARLRLLLGVRPGVKKLQFRYMFFGKVGEVVILPPPFESKALPGPKDA